MSLNVAMKGLRMTEKIREKPMPILTADNDGSLSVLGIRSDGQAQIPAMIVGKENAEKVAEWLMKFKLWLEETEKEKKDDAALSDRVLDDGGDVPSTKKL